MLNLHTTTVGGYRVRVVCTERVEGDMHPVRAHPDDLARRQRAVTGTTWPMLDQVHGLGVVRVHSHTAPFPVGDIAVSAAGGSPVAVWAADCAPLALIGSDGRVGVVHAGWRGLSTGVVGAGVSAIAGQGITVDAAVLGPVIHPCCYEFPAAEIARVASSLGCDEANLTGTTSWGTIAFDVPAAVQCALGAQGLSLVACGPCTGCDRRWFSHRRRCDLGRHALIAWSEQL